MDQNNPSVPTVGVDTSSWNIPGMVATPVDMQQPKEMFTPDPKMPEVNDRSSEIKAFLGNMRYDAQASMKKDDSKDWISKMDPTQGKISLSTEIPLEQTHDLMNDGETWIPKYDSFLIGVDNDSRLAAQQSSGRKILNVFERFASNTSKGVLDIGAFVYGVGASAITGRFDALFDNDMSKYVDDLANKTNFEYKNYYDAETRNKSLGFDVQTIDKVFGGAEFTARMFASEAVIALATGGLSLPSTLARGALRGINAVEKVAELGKVATVGRNISKMMSLSTIPERATAEAGNIARLSDKFTEGLKAATKRGRLGELLVQSRFAVTSPMYESGFEALHFRKDAEQQFFQYYKDKGIQPTTEQINAFSNKLAGSSDAVFLTNMALLSVSNLALFGDMLSINNPLSKSIYSPSNFLKNSVFKIGTEKSVETGLNQALKASLWNKAAAYVSPVLKGALIEGVYEEGSQGIASGTLKNYVASAYDEKSMRNTANYVDAFGKAFQDQWGTKNGREEVLIGALIGGLFGGGVGGIKNVNREYKQQKGIANLQNVGEEFVENFKTSAYTNEQLLSLFSSQGRFQNLRKLADTAEQKGDKLGEASAKAQSFITLLDSYHSVGKDAEFTKMFGSMLKGMDNQSIADSTGMDISEVDAFKQEQIQGMNNISEKYATARKAAGYIFRPNIGGFVEQEIDGEKVKISPENLVSSFAFATTMGAFHEKFAGDTFSAFQEKLAQVNTSQELIDKVTALGALKSAHKLEQDKYTELSGQENQLSQEINQITQQLNTLDKGEEKTQSAGKRVELADKLLNTQSRLRDVANKKDALWKNLVDNFYVKMNKSGFATQLDLTNFTKQVQDIQDSLDNLSLGKEDKIILEKLLKQFNESNDAYKDFTVLADNLSNPKFTFKTYRGIISGTRAKLDKSLNEHTRESLLKIYGYSTDLQNSLKETYSENTPLEFDSTKTEKEYKATEKDLASIKNKIDTKRQLAPNEQKFYDNNRESVDSYESEDIKNPADSESTETEINEISIKKQAKQNELEELQNGIYSDEIQKKIDKINSDIENLQEEIDNLKNNTILTKSVYKEFIDTNNVPQNLIEKIADKIQNSEKLTSNEQSIFNSKTFEVNNILSNRLVSDSSSKLDQEISELEKEISELEKNGKVDEPHKKRIVESQKNSYQQYEYIKPNGTPIIGYLEVNKGILQLVNESEIVDIQETQKSLEDINTQNIKGLTEIGEDILIEGDEIYVNGKIYKTQRGTKSLDENISKDKDGNYEVRLRAANGRVVTLRGNVADTIVYENLLNKIEQDATDEQIERYKQQAESDIRIEKKYEELISKTKDRDSEQEKIRKESEEKSRQNQEKIDSKQVEQNSRIKDKAEIIESEKIKILEELAILQNNFNQETRKNLIKSRIKELRDKLLSEYSDNQISNERISDIKSLSYLEDELQKMEEVKEDFNPDGTPLEQLDWIIGNISDLNFESADDLVEGIQKPVQADVDEYIDLLNKTDKTAKDKKRVSELRDKLLPYNLADGLELDGVNILDIINLYNQSKNIQTIDETQESEVNEQTFQESTNSVKQTSDGRKGEYRSPKVGLVYDGAYIENQNGLDKIFHVKLFSFLSKSLEKGFNPMIVVYKDSSKPTMETEQEIEINQNNLEEMSKMFDSRDNIKIDLGDGLYLKKPKGEKSFHVYNGNVLFLLDAVGYEITGQSTGYKLLYEPKSDGTFGAKESEFTVKRGDIQIPFDKEVLNSIKPGERLTLEYDPQDNYNQTLLPNERVSKGQIYVKKNGKLVQILKATDVEGKVKGEGWEELEAIRKQVITSKNAIEITVEKSYLGLPIITLNSDKSLKEVPVDESKVLAYGYMDAEGKLQGDIKKYEGTADNSQYVETLKDKGKITPVVAFSAYGKTILFPLNLKLKGVNLTQNVDDIMQDRGKTEEQKMLEINSLLEQNGLFTKELALNNSNRNIDAVKNALSDVQSKIDITDPKQFEDADKYVYINLNDPFMSSKLVFDLKNSSKFALEVGKMTKEQFKQHIKSRDGIGIDAVDDNLC